MSAKSSGLHGHGIEGGASTSDDRPQPTASRSKAGHIQRDETLQDPNCVMQLHAPPFRALYAGDGRRNLRLHRRSRSSKSRKRCATTRGASARARSATRSAGPCTPLACRLSARRAFCKLCSATWAAPAAASWLCAATASIQGSTDIPTLYDLAARIHAAADCRKAHDTLDEYVKYEGLPTGYWVHFRGVHGQPAESLLRRRRPQRQTTICYNWLPRVDDDYSMLPSSSAWRKANLTGYFMLGQNPAAGRSTPMRAPRRSAKAEMAGGRRLVRDRHGHLLEKRPDRPAAGRNRHRGVLHSRRLRRRKRKAPAPIPSGSSSGTTRLLTRPATAAPTPGLSTTWASASRRCTPAPLIRRTTLSRRLTWDYDEDEPKVLPDGSVSQVEGEPDDQQDCRRDQRLACQGDRPGDSEAKAALAAFADLQRRRHRLRAAAGFTPA